MSPLIIVITFSAIIDSIDAFTFSGKTRYGYTDHPQSRIYA